MKTPNLDNQIERMENDINNDSFDKNDKGLGKVSRIANKYIIKLR